ncbi:hypothetical protein [Desulfobulbus elongatus]|uniref:hypothetical protein n=1 Tax=Desulfobulbus elongatus TaxID=53332 RepID=UPI0012FAD0D4|nr:hypothetical protein [Desulfobulbus elongatus]
MKKMRAIRVLPLLSENGEDIVFLVSEFREEGKVGAAHDAHDAVVELEPGERRKRA